MITFDTYDFLNVGFWIIDIIIFILSIKLALTMKNLLVKGCTVLEMLRCGLGKDNEDFLIDERVVSLNLMEKALGYYTNIQIASIFRSSVGTIIAQLIAGVPLGQSPTMLILSFTIAFIAFAMWRTSDKPTVAILVTIVAMIFKFI